MSRKKRYLQKEKKADDSSSSENQPFSSKADTPANGNENIAEILFRGATSNEREHNSNCRCFEIMGLFYCHRLEQGRWVQSSGIGYPTQEMCEENLDD